MAAAGLYAGSRGRSPHRKMQTVPLPTPALSYAVVILAAGASSRMGKPKLLLPWGHTSVLGHLIEQWRDLQAAQIAVVCAGSDGAVQGELDRLAFPRENRVLNPMPERGMFSSIQCAARWPGWKENLSHFAIALGDQPHLHLATVRALLDFAKANPEKICQPSRLGHGRHPVVFPKVIFQQLRESQEENLKTFLRNGPYEAARCEVDDPALDLDMDTPADYAHILRLFSSRDS